MPSNLDRLNPQENRTSKATVRGGAPYAWAAVTLNVVQSGTKIDVVDWVANDALPFLTDTGATTLLMLALGTAYNVIALARSGGWFEKVVKLVPGLPEYDQIRR